jgi:hypothetical protein
MPERRIEMSFATATSEVRSPARQGNRTLAWVSKAMLAAAVVGATVVGLATTSWAGPIAGC